jgi:hypothetical protein
MLDLLDHASSRHRLSHARIVLLIQSHISLLAATIESDAPSLVRWITGRARWEELDLKAAGDADALGIARSLKVY